MKGHCDHNHDLDHDLDLNPVNWPDLSSLPGLKISVGPAKSLTPEEVEILRRVAVEDSGHDYPLTAQIIRITVHDQGKDLLELGAVTSPDFKGEHWAEVFGGVVAQWERTMLVYALEEMIARMAAAAALRDGGLELRLDAKETAQNARYN